MIFNERNSLCKSAFTATLGRKIETRPNMNLNIDCAVNFNEWNIHACYRKSGIPEYRNSYQISIERIPALSHPAEWKRCTLLVFPEFLFIPSRFLNWNFVHWNRRAWEWWMLQLPFNLQHFRPVSNRYASYEIYTNRCTPGDFLRCFDLLRITDESSEKEKKRWEERTNVKWKQIFISTFVIHA